MNGKIRRVLLSTISACAMVGWLAGPARAAAGDLDPGFGGGDGQAATKFSQGGAFGHNILVQGDGRILVSGEADHSADDVEWAIVRYKPNGTLDPSFGTNGRVLTNLTGGFDSTYGMAKAGGGKFYVAGYASTSFAVARYLPDGHLDHAFSGDGVAIVPFPSGQSFGYAIAVGAGGKVVLAGQVNNAGGVSRFAVVRLTKAGTLDHSFGGDGRVTTDLGPNSYAYSVIALAGGGVIAVGDANTTAHTSPGVVKYRSDGTLDPDFGEGGIAVDEVGEDLSPNDVLRLSSGKLLLEGAYRTGPATFSLGVVRLQSNGHPDATFGPNGLVTRDFGGTSDYPGRFVRAGQRILVATGHQDGADNHLGVIRLMMNGAADTGFGDGGLALATLDHSSGGSVAVDADGHVLVAGYAGASDDVSRFFVARFLGS
jgi:uncharacterized delta-60 repeat protein